MVEWSKMQHKLWAHQHHSLYHVDDRGALPRKLHKSQDFDKIKETIPPLLWAWRWDADVLGRWNAHVTFNWESFPLCQLFFYTCCWCPVSKCQIQFNCQTNKPQKPGPCAPAASCLEGHIPLSFRWSWFNCTSMWEYKKGKRRGHFAETLLLSPTGCRCHFEWMREKWLDLELTTGGGLG